MDTSLPGDASEPMRPARLPALWHALERVRARRTLRAARRAADIELAHRDSPPLRLAWRVEELVATKNRLDLAHSLRSLVRDAGPRYLPTASPVNRLAVRGESETLLAVAGRLADLERPVAARGVVLTAVRPRARRRPSHVPRHGTRRFGAPLMVEILGIVIAVLCFAAAFALVVLFERV
jgi:hypothetical protein